MRCLPGATRQVHHRPRLHNLSRRRTSKPAKPHLIHTPRSGWAWCLGASFLFVRATSSTQYISRRVTRLEARGNNCLTRSYKLGLDSTPGGGIPPRLQLAGSASRILEFIGEERQKRKRKNRRSCLALGASSLASRIRKLFFFGASFGLTEKRRRRKELATLGPQTARDTRWRASEHLWERLRTKGYG
jgi:hypothetical protein